MTGKYLYSFSDILSSAENILTLHGGLVSISFDPIENEDYHRIIGYDPYEGLIDDFLIAIA